MLFSKPSPPGGGITTGKTPFTLSTSSSSCNCGSGDPAIRPARASTDAPIVYLYYPVFRVWAGYGGFGI